MTAGIEDVARAAGVSTATVSRALRGLPGVSERTRAAVARLAREMDYSPSRSASSLSSGKTRSIGIVVPAVSRWFFATAIEGAAKALRDADYDAILYSIPDSTSPRKPFDAEQLRSRVDGVLVMSMPFTEEEARALRRLQVPAAFVSVAQPGFNQVGIDDVAAAVTAVNHLIDLGHEVIGHVSGAGTDSNSSSPTSRRREGWRKALTSAKLEASEELDAPSDITAVGGYQAAKTLLSRRNDITAILASSDEAAFGIVAAARDLGLSPGVDLSIIGIDGHDLGEFTGLSTVEQPVFAQGEAAASLLLDSVGGSEKAVQRIEFETKLVVRSSTNRRNY